MSGDCDWRKGSVHQRISGQKNFGQWKSRSRIEGSLDTDSRCTSFPAIECCATLNKGGRSIGDSVVIQSGSKIGHTIGENVLSETAFYWRPRSIGAESGYAINPVNSRVILLRFYLPGNICVTYTQHKDLLRNHRTQRKEKSYWPGNPIGLVN